MAELTAAQTTEYLKQVATIETSLYQQTEVKKKAHDELVMPKVTKCQVTKPEKRSVKEPDKPYFHLACFTWFPMIMAIVALVFVAGEVWLVVEKEPQYAIIVFAVGAAVELCIFLVYLFYSIWEYKSDQKTYQAQCAYHATEVQAAEKKYAEQMKRYNADVEAANAEYNLAVQTAQTKFEAASTEVAKLDAPLVETRQLLDQLYAMDIIFPKYRNMVAICTMYEYFAAGRCTELTGANGAYNLYEQELRQNLIINQLEQVNANLEQVKQNQYILYQGIMETNQALQSMSHDIRGILNLTTDIAESSKVTAFCSKITAANTEALKYIALRNSL